jgi:hypothetical protein
LRLLAQFAILFYWGRILAFAFLGRSISRRPERRASFVVSLKQAGEPK